MAPSDESPLTMRRLFLELVSDDRRVIALPFSHGIGVRAPAVKAHVSQLSQAELAQTLGDVLASFRGRHENIEDLFAEHYEMAAGANEWANDMSKERRMLIGAYLTLEYSIQSAALFNPSIAPHPDQTGAPEGGVRFVMSLRATGEGHVSSIVFRTGVIDAGRHLTVDPPAHYSARARLAPDQSYIKVLFRRTMTEMAAHLPTVDLVLDELSDQFTFHGLEATVQTNIPPATTPTTKSARPAAAKKVAQTSAAWPFCMSFSCCSPDCRGLPFSSFVTRAMFIP